MKSEELANVRRIFAMIWQSYKITQTHDMLRRANARRNDTEEEIEDEHEPPVESGLDRSRAMFLVDYVAYRDAVRNT
ncbi:unnamed protein product, partial [Allacma fusca]